MRRLIMILALAISCLGATASVANAYGPTPTCGDNCFVR
jgi:hypothetical protein